jgi:hypothetical protein
MPPFRLALVLSSVALLGSAALHAQPAPPRPRASPHETVSTRIDGNRVMLVYGRPHLKDPKTGQPRRIWGALVPYGKIWRTGADEATLLVTQQPIELGGVTVPAGAYTLFLLPAEHGASRLLVSKQIGQWGNEAYDEKQELARIELKHESLATPVDQFTMAVEKNPAGGGMLKLAWESTQFSVPFAVKK